MNIQLGTALLSILILVSCFGEVESYFVVRNDNNGSFLNKYPAIDKLNPQVGNNILEIFEDSKGNLWFGTTDGVARFDGEHLTYLTSEDGLCGKTVTDIIEDEQGTIWFGTHSDMCLYQEGTFVSFPKTEGESIPTLGYGWKSVQTDNSGNVYVNTHQGIFHYSNPSSPMGKDQFTKFDIEVQTEGLQSYCNTAGVVSLYLIDQNGNHWFGTDGDGAYMHDGESFTHYTKEDGLLSNYVASIEEDNNGRIWFGCTKAMGSDDMNGGLCMLDVSGDNKSNRSIQGFPHVVGLSGTDIRTIKKDKEGNLWIGATGKGVYKFISKGNEVDKNSFTHYNEPAEINLELSGYTTGLQSMLEDSNGKLWFGFSGGLFYLDGNEFVNVTKEEGWN